MKYRFKILILFSTIFAGCSQNHEPIIKSYEYKLGFKDGCSTGMGTYTKEHTLFRTNKEYKAGWVNGNAECLK